MRKRIEKQLTYPKGCKKWIMAIITSSDKRKAAKLGITAEEYVSIKAAELAAEKEIIRAAELAVLEAKRIEKEAAEKAAAELKAIEADKIAAIKAAEKRITELAIAEKAAAEKAARALRLLFEKMSLTELRAHLLKLSSTESERLEKSLREECAWLISAGICNSKEESLLREDDEFKSSFVRAVLRLEAQKNGLQKMDVEVRYEYKAKSEWNGRNSDELCDSSTYWYDVYTILVDGKAVDSVEFKRSYTYSGVRHYVKSENIAKRMSGYNWPQKIMSLDDIDFYMCPKGGAFFISEVDSGDLKKFTLFINPNTRLWDLDDL